LRAAKGENVPVNELKSALITAIKIMLRSHPLNDTVVRVLNSAKMTLEETLNDIALLMFFKIKDGVVQF
jgi:hypothetical protein